MPTLTHSTEVPSPVVDVEYDYEELPETSPLTMHLIAGAAAGIMEHSVMYPFDIVKVGAAGGVATIVSDALMNPFDVIKQRMQLAGTGYRNIVDCASKVLRHEGLRAFYVSYPTTLMMNMPFQSIQFGCYDIFRRTLNPTGSYSPITHVFAGGMAGAVAGALTTPIDCCKTLLQTRGASADMEVRAANSMDAAARIIFKKQGLSGFTRGMKPRVIANFPATAISWTTYEYFKWVISRRDAKRNF
ncbi:Fe(2+) transporter [Coemansia sp. RSA 2530]|nr:Fe(2+) transporter [Coemansia sp. RSA 2530]